VRVIATYSIKGGVGKTSAAVNLAALAALEGRRTLLWDLDPQGAATYLLRVKPRVRGGAGKLVRGKSDVTRLVKGSDVEGLDLLPADFSYRHMDLALDGAKKPAQRLGSVLAPLADDYDLAFLDCPPSISLVSESVFETADALLVPLIPATLSLRTYDQLMDFVAAQVASPPRVIGFFSMVDRRRKLHRIAVETLPAERPGIAAAAIPSRSEVEMMGIHRAPLTVTSRRGAGTRAYAALWAEVCRRLAIS
jgi:cellulose biosynthesis protein BcsQ